VSAAKDSIAQDSGSGKLELQENNESAKQARQAWVAGGKQVIQDAVNAACNQQEKDNKRKLKGYTYSTILIKILTTEIPSDQPIMLVILRNILCRAAQKVH